MHDIKKVFEMYNGDYGQIVKEYCKQFYTFPETVEKLDKLEVLTLDPPQSIAYEIGERDIFGVSIGNLESMTKKLCLLNENFLVTETGEGCQRYMLEHQQEYTASATGRDVDKYLFLNTFDIDGLGRWLIDSKQMIMNDSLIYYPNLSYEVYDILYKDTGNLMQDNIGSRIIACNGNSMKLNSLINLNIPSLEGIKYCDYIKILNEYHDLFIRFSSELQLRLLEIDTDNEHELRQKCKKIEIAMNKELIKITECYKLELKKYFNNIISAGIGTTVVSLVLYNFSSFPELINKIIMSSAIGAIPIIQSTRDYLNRRLEIKNNDYYFLWILNKTQ